MTTYTVHCATCGGDIDFLDGDPTQPVCAQCRHRAALCTCLDGKDLAEVADDYVHLSAREFDAKYPNWHRPAFMDELRDEFARRSVSERSAPNDL